MAKEYWINDIDQAAMGADSIAMSESRMPVLNKLNTRFTNEQPLAGITIGACLHVTPETAVLVRTLKAGGAKVVLCGSNPLSTQDDVAAALVKDGFNVYAWKGNDAEYYDCLRLTLAQSPDIVIDDGADLIVTAHTEAKNLVQNMIGSQEETTTGVKRLRVMEQEGALKTPVIAVNDASIKMMFDNRYGTGQGVVSAIKALNVLFAGKSVIVAGYGWCSKGLAMRAKGLGANVVITEIDPLKALEAVMDGYRVMPMAQAAKIGDLFVTITGDINVIRKEHFENMKSGAIVANSGHFNVEIDIPALQKLAAKTRKEVRQFVDEYTLPNGHKIFILADGRLINLAAAEGHPASVMDMSFATQALSTEFALKEKKDAGVYSVPKEIEDYISKLKLETMGIKIDELTEEQKEYLSSWEMGT